MTNTTTGASADAIELLISDHHDVEQLFTMMDGARTTGDVDQQRYVAEHVVETSLYTPSSKRRSLPGHREALPDGDELADEALQEHQEVKELLTRIDGKDPQSEDARAAFDELTANIRHHVQEEENELLPRTRAALGQDRLQEMRRKLETARQAAPTHPIPTPPTRRSAMWPLERLRPWSTRSATSSGAEQPNPARRRTQLFVQPGVQSGR